MELFFWFKIYILGALVIFWLIFLGLERSLFWATVFLFGATIWTGLFFESVFIYFLLVFVLEIWVVVLIYQEEIRRFFKKSSSAPLYSSVAKEIGDFLEFALRNKLCGILVFKRKDDLKAFKETGELIRAKVDALVLSQFFAPDSLFKSRAVIIEGEEVVAVNCVLPQTGPRYLDKMEQSAFALSQISDALIVVFKEGKLTLFLEGSRTKTTPQRVGAILKTLRSGQKIRVV